MTNEILVALVETVGISFRITSKTYSLSSFKRVPPPPQGSEAAEAATTGKCKTQCSTARHRRLKCLRRSTFFRFRWGLTLPPPPLLQCCCQCRYVGHDLPGSTSLFSSFHVHVGICALKNKSRQHGNSFSLFQYVRVSLLGHLLSVDCNIRM